MARLFGQVEGRRLTYKRVNARLASPRRPTHPRLAGWGDPRGFIPEPTEGKEPANHLPDDPPGGLLGVFVPFLKRISGRRTVTPPLSAQLRSEGPNAFHRLPCRLGGPWYPRVFALLTRGTDFAEKGEERGKSRSLRKPCLVFDEMIRARVLGAPLKQKGLQDASLQ